jgi:ribosomal protein S18 acetylase RimI-like enzyme
VKVEVVVYRRPHLDAVIALCEEARVFEAFSSDRERAGRALEGPGALSLVALRNEDEVVGFSHAITDGAFQAYLSLLLVRPGARRQGIGRRLVAETLARCGAARLELISYEEADPLYASFPHERFAGVSAFRLLAEQHGR